VATLDSVKTDVSDESTRDDIRNIAIIAHVDHGKTTLTDALMKQTGKAAKTSMDSNQLEMERGITILAKNAAIKYKGIKINLIDTPGHADFGGEVERILNMADACLLLVDAQEGPMPQTKFVLRLALKLGRRVIVCINKVDKPASRPDWVLDTTFDLFAALGADDNLCDFPVVYASGFKGVASTEGPDQLKEDLSPLLDTILKECPKPSVQVGAPLQMMVSNLDYDDYIGRICIGRLRGGSVKVGQQVGFQHGEGSEVRIATVTKLWEFNNNERTEVEEVTGGDIGAFAGNGMDDVTIGDTVVDPENPTPLPPIIVEEPTVAMEFGVNTSPFAGRLKESTHLTSREIKSRLEKECLTNLALRCEPGSTTDCFRVKGRGTLQLGILMENMRREGYEMMIGAPEVILRKDPETGAKQEPYEECVVDVPGEYQGVIMEEMQKKNATMKTMESGAVEGNMVLTFEIPTRGLIGMLGKFASRTKGMAVMNSRFSHWGDYNGEQRIREKGSIVAHSEGVATSYTLLKMKTKGSFFVDAGEDVFQGMCVGIHIKESDIEVNIAAERAATNVRAKKSDVGDSYPPPLQFAIDDYLGHMDSDEMLEVTPKNLRLCKKNAKGLKGR
jgi:GTP-binding protein